MNKKFYNLGALLKTTISETHVLLIEVYMFEKDKKRRTCDVIVIPTKYRIGIPCPYLLTNFAFLNKLGSQGVFSHIRNGDIMTGIHLVILAHLSRRLTR